MGSYFSLRLNIAEENKPIKQASGEKQELKVAKYYKKKQEKH